MTQEVKEIIKKVRKLEIKTNKLVKGLISGNYRSVFRGTGIEFSEVREYVPGDDIRYIDWNVTARMGIPFIKEFIEERDLNVYIAFDISGSNNFGFEITKRSLGLEIAASLMFSALRNNDNIGLCLFSDSVELFIKPAKGRKHVLLLLRELVCREGISRKTDINKSLIRLSKIIKRQSIIFVFSDFISLNFDKPLKFLKNRHDLVLVKLSDIRESNIPDLGYVFIEDGETGEQLIVNTSNREFKEYYSGISNKRGEEFARRMKRLRIDLIQIDTGESSHKPLLKFFHLRERRMVR